ncbi:hypothetical protein Q1695_006508 [Nippostrongylus brasiliensis]|nr:hypothetical protein Q1695_006508 [Nippostrongylus brasiliensis]
MHLQLTNATALMCSTCSEAVCGDGKCLTRWQLCNGVADCRDASDEQGCDGISFRLSAGNDEISGTVQVFFKGAWQPVCEQGFSQDAANAVCTEIDMQTPARIMNSSVTNKVGWLIDCTERCSLRVLTFCRRAARIHCHSPKTDALSSCGVRRVNAAARNPLHARFARVVGGFDTVAGAFPWTAAIRSKSNEAHHCGATILDKTHLITAAHCFEDDRRPSSYVVIAGDWDNNVTEGHEQTFDVLHLHFYPLYEDLFSHDLAVIEIERPGMRFDDWTTPICLPPRDFEYQTGRKCVVTGWGSIGFSYPSRLQAAVLPIIDRMECMNSSRIYSSMSRSAFCAGYLQGSVDSCQGDSGGPFACKSEDGTYVLAGVISWGDGCAEKGQPGIYTMVAPYLSWIQDILGKH